MPRAAPQATTGPFAAGEATFDGPDASSGAAAVLAGALTASQAVTGAGQAAAQAGRCH
ncbi:hypothetical protein [Oryzisolibacter propanilivorax]|uniref:hypothetical protein n=1 Tax=Oryzisolibacter propanilivorax TaxID=1527607 RepID=UPI001587B415|nr:hypothetical protein [Oryzisolibacter propanilivorax]